MSLSSHLVLHMVDVFGSTPLSGNPLAVVSGAQNLDPAEMQRLTRWFNLSETAFLLPPSDPRADYSVRIFTLERELPFAGHPTLGSCHAWLQGGGLSKNREEVIQECGIGLVTLRRGPQRLSFAAPPLLRSGHPAPHELEEAMRFLGVTAGDVLDAAWIDNGPGWLGIRMASAQQVLALQPARSWPQRIDIGVVGPHPPGGDAAFEVRALFSDQHGTTVEDPVTGSLNASVAQWLLASGLATAPYVAAQGTCIGRRGRIYIDQDASGQVWIGGNTRTMVDGALHLL